MNSVRRLAATRSQARPYEAQAGTTMKTAYAPAATTPVRMSEMVTGLLKSIADSMERPIVPHGVDDQGGTRKRAEDTEAEGPAAGDVGPPVHAQVDARAADRDAQQDARRYQRGPARKPAEHSGRDRGEHDVDRGVGGVAARVGGAARVRQLVGRTRAVDRALRDVNGGEDEQQSAEQHDQLERAPTPREERTPDQHQRGGYPERPERRDHLGDVLQPTRVGVACEVVERLVAGRRLRPAPAHDRCIADEHEQPHGRDREGGGQLDPEHARREPIADEAKRRPQDSPHGIDHVPQHGREHGLALDPCAKLVAAAVRRDHAEDQRDEDAEHERGPAGDPCDLLERAIEEVADQDVHGRPQARAEDAVRDEVAIAHPRRAGDERRHRPDETDEAADQDRLAAVALEVALDHFEALVRDLEPRAMALEEGPPEAAPDEEARGVARDAAQPDEREQRDERDGALPSDDTADDDRELARRDQADERARLQEGENADEGIRALPERLGEVLDQLLRVREAGERAGGVRREQRDDEQAYGDLAAVETAATLHDERQQRGGGDGSDDVARAHRALRRAVTTAPSMPAAARSAASWSVKTPQVVGPEPATSAPSASARRSSASVPSSSGRSASAAGWRSFSSAPAMPP